METPQFPSLSVPRAQADPGVGNYRAGVSPQLSGCQNYQLLFVFAIHHNLPPVVTDYNNKQGELYFYCINLIITTQYHANLYASNNNILLLHNETRQLQVMILLTSQTVEVRAGEPVAVCSPHLDISYSGTSHHTVLTRAI